MKNVASLLIYALVANLFFGARVWAVETAASNYLTNGISLYERKDYAGAQDSLYKAINGEFKNVAIAYYYLANSLMQMRKTNAALDAYERCYDLAPFSSFSGYCRMVLLKNGRSLDARAGASGQKNAAGQSSDALKKAEFDKQQKEIQEKESQAAVESKPATDPELARLSSRLPRLVVLTKESPPASEIMAGNIFYRSGFVAEAEARKNRAFEHLEQSRQALTRAESLTHSFIPSSKSFGEGDEEFKTRRAEAEKSVSGLLDPFRENVKVAETSFQTESTLLENCINASRGFQY